MGCGGFFPPVAPAFYDGAFFYNMCPPQPSQHNPRLEPNRPHIAGPFALKVGGFLVRIGGMLHYNWSCGGPYLFGCNLIYEFICPIPGAQHYGVLKGQKQHVFTSDVVEPLESQDMCRWFWYMLAIQGYMIIYDVSACVE